MVQPCGKNMWKKVFLRKLKIELLHDPVIPLLGYYPDETVLQKVTRTPCAQHIHNRQDTQRTEMSIYRRRRKECPLTS